MERGEVICPTDKLVLCALWDAVPAEHCADASAEQCRLTAAEIADRIGSNSATVKKAHRRLAAAGWLRAMPPGHALAWGTPWPWEPTILSGYLYALEFSNSTVKVGRSNDPHRRIAEHAQPAACLGIAVARSWVSQELDDVIAAESSLVKQMAAHHARRGVEYFVGGFDLAVSIVEELAGRRC